MSQLFSLEAAAAMATWSERCWVAACRLATPGVPLSPLLRNPSHFERQAHSFPVGIAR